MCNNFYSSLTTPNICYQLTHDEVDLPSFSLRMLYWSLCCWIWDSCWVIVVCICSFWDDTDATCSFSSWIWASWAPNNQNKTVNRRGHQIQISSSDSCSVCLPVLWSALCTELQCCHVAPTSSSPPLPSSPLHWTCELLWLSHLFRVEGEIICETAAIMIN